MFLDLLTQMFPGGRTLRLVKNGINITNSSNPLTLTKNITLTIVDYDYPPPILYSIWNLHSYFFSESEPSYYRFKHLYNYRYDNY